MIFQARLLRPAQQGADDTWSFLVLPKAVSETLPRRGRTSVAGTLNGAPFQATLDPDGQLSHWLKESESLRVAAGAAVGDTVTVDVAALDPAPEPVLPADLAAALRDAPAARTTWNGTTTIARLDWIHWVTTARA